MWEVFKGFSFFITGCKFYGRNSFFGNGGGKSFDVFIDWFVLLEGFVIDDLCVCFFKFIAFKALSLFVLLLKTVFLAAVPLPVLS